jgi:hypothetical protein
MMHILEKPEEYHHMSDKISPALSPEQWEARDYRQPARELDDWAKRQAGKTPEDDATEYVAKIGLSEKGSVILMNRAHDRVLVPPPARAVLAAFALMDQPFGFTQKDVAALRKVAELGKQEDKSAAMALRGLADRIAALLPAGSGE